MPVFMIFNFFCFLLQLAVPLKLIATLVPVRWHKAQKMILIGTECRNLMGTLIYPKVSIQVANACLLVHSVYTSKWTAIVCCSIDSVSSWQFLRNRSIILVSVYAFGWNCVSEKIQVKVDLQDPPLKMFVTLLPTLMQVLSILDTLQRGSNGVLQNSLRILPRSVLCCHLLIYIYIFFERCLFMSFKSKHKSNNTVK